MKNFKAASGCFAVILLALALLFSAAGGAAFAGGDGGGVEDEFVPGEVLAPADSLEQALSIAAAYGLTLKSYAYGVAVLAASDPQEEVAHSQGMAAAFSPLAGGRLPELSLNRLYRVDEVAETEYGEGQWHHELLDSARAWELTQGEGVIVAVIDTGIDTVHPKFEGRILPNSYNSHTDQTGLSFVQDDLGHGTHVSGIIAASQDGYEAVCGVAPAVQILVIKSNMPEDPDHLQSASWLRGLNYAVENGAAVVNMSFGAHYVRGADSLEQSTLAAAAARGVTVVCAAGNSRYAHAGYPAAYPEAIAVSAVKVGGLFESSYSNYGPEIDIAAPGSEVYATVMGGGYDVKSGTSMASPCVAGVAALIKASHPAYTAQEVRDVLCRTAFPTALLGQDSYLGYGVVNAYGAALGYEGTYRVAFDYNDGVRAPFIRYLVSGSRLTEPHAPSREGCFFDCWSASAGGGGEFDFNGEITADITLYAQWVEIVPGMFAYEFPDENFRNEALRLLNEQDDGDRRASQMMSGADIGALAAVSELQLSDKKIVSLRGLAYFEALQTLICDRNFLLELDVSANSHLRALNCNANYLAALDVSANSALTSLSCAVNNIKSPAEVAGASENPALVLGNNFIFYPQRGYSPPLGTDITVSFLDDAFLAIVRELIGKPYGPIYDYDVAKITDLTIYMSGIEDLSGIEHFTALTRLSCWRNRLSELDLTNNSELTVVNCSANRLTKLNVSKNTKLSTLDCDSNLLSELYLANNTRLSQLSCKGNQFETLELSQNTALTYLDCGENLLAELDISQNTRLTTFYCNGNLLRSLDLTKNTALEYLYCPGNSLMELDISKCLVLTRLDCSRNPWTELTLSGRSLDNLRCENCPWLTRLDITGSPVLTSLICDGNQLTDLDVSQNTALTRLTCFYNRLPELDVSQNTVLETLACSNNRLTELDVSHNTTLSSISCNNNLLTTLDFPQPFPELGFINCSYNYLTNMDVSNCPDLFYLDCTNNDMQTPQDVSGQEYVRPYIILLFFPQRGQVNAQPPLITLQPQSVTVNQRQTATLSVEAIGSGVLSYQWFERGIDLFDNYPISGATAATYDAPTVAVDARRYFCRITNTDHQATGVKTAVVSSNLVTVTVLRDTTDRTDITASFTDPNFLAAVRNAIGVYEGPIYDSDVEGISRLIINNRNIADLSGIEHFRDLSVLWCDFNRLSAFDLSQNRALTELHCTDNQFSELDVSAITNLTYLYCSNNQLTELNLSKNTTLGLLNCQNNALTVLDLTNNPALRVLYCNNNLLSSLDLSNCSQLFRLQCQNNYLIAEESIRGLEALRDQLATYTFFDQYPQIYITAQPAAFTAVYEGEISGALHTAVAATQSANIRYQWYRNNSPANSGGAPVSGAVTPVFTLPAYLSAGAYYYYCVASVTNGLGAAETASDVATVRVFSPGEAVTAAGQILYQPSPRLAQVELLDNAGYTVASASTDTVGAYTLTAPVGTYSLKVTKPGYLSYTVHNYSFGGSPELAAIDISQLAGDVNGDGVVNSIDLTYLLSEFNRAPQQYPYADIDGDGLVNSVDLTYLLAGFNKRAVVSGL